MLSISQKTRLRIPYLIGIIIAIYLLKPKLIFKDNGKARIFGVGYDDEGYKKTLYTFEFVIFLAIALLFVLI